MIEEEVWLLFTCVEMQDTKNAFQGMEDDVVGGSQSLWNELRLPVIVLIEILQAAACNWILGDLG